MPEIPNVFDYRTKTSPLSLTTERKEKTEAAKIDEEFLRRLIMAQGLLEENQRLILTVSLTLPQNTEEGEFDGYRGVISDAPFSLRRQLAKLLEAAVIVIEGCNRGESLPDEIDISIPPNVIPVSDDDVANISASRGAVLSGQVRRFLAIQSVGDVYLEVNPTGVLLNPRLNFHPSLIHNIELKTVSNQQSSTPICSFKAVKS